MNVIVCSAIRSPMGVIICGARHHHCLASLHDLRTRLELSNMSGAPLAILPTADKWEQGFVDETNKFLTREEAWPIAEAAGQICRRCGGDGEKLFSENLY